MIKRKPSQTAIPGRGKWSTVILYESSAARARALESWRGLEEQHASEEKLSVDWFSFAQLREPGLARKAAAKATVADFIVFAAREDGDVPGEIKQWMESWLCKRRAREGTIVGLMEREHTVAAPAGVKEIYFRHMAHRAGMDYLSKPPPAAAATARSLPDSLDSVRERAGRMTSVLDTILQTPSLPPRF